MQIKFNITNLKKILLILFIFIFSSCKFINKKNQEINAEKNKIEILGILTVEIPIKFKEATQEEIIKFYGDNEENKADVAFLNNLHSIVIGFNIKHGKKPYVLDSMLKNKNKIAEFFKSGPTVTYNECSIKTINNYPFLFISNTETGKKN